MKRLSSIHLGKKNIEKWKHANILSQHSSNDVFIRRTGNFLVNSKSSSAFEPFYGYPREETKESLGSLQNTFVAVRSAVSVFADPARADALSALGETTGHLALHRMRQRMALDPTGRRILKERPLINNSTIDMESLKNMTCEGGGKSFGQTYYDFMEKHGFDPEEREDVKFISDPELAYVMLRYRQCHDFWHALCDLPPTVMGELALKWIELLQTGLPVAALSAVVGPLRLTKKKRDVLFTQYFPWAVKVGTNSSFLMNVYYEEEFKENVDELRSKLGIIPAPKIRQ